MGKIKVSAMPTASTLTGAEIAMVLQGGQNKQTTLSQVVNLVNGAIYSVEYTLSSAQILDLHNTAVQFLAPPGVDKYYQPISMDGNYFFNSIPYTRINAAAINIFWDGVTNSATGFGALLTQTFNCGSSSGGLGSGLSSTNHNLILDKGLFFKILNPSSSFTLGDGTLKMKVLYHIVTV